MALTTISTILLRGLDLTIANIMIGDYEMGLLSIARTMPNNVTSIIATIAPIFTPVMISYYVKGNMDELKNHVKKSINVMSMLLYVPITGFIVFSYDFYALWQKSLNSNELMIVTVISIITVLQAYFNSTTSIMAQLSVVSNKLKMPVLVSFGCGVLSVISELLLIKFTGLGLYAIVLPTSAVMIVRYVLFNSMYGAYCIKQPKWIFLPGVIKVWISIPILLAIMILVRHILPVYSWIGFCRDVMICSIAGYGVMIVIYGREELKTILNKRKRVWETSK